jgi:hypothetical protein
MGFKTFRKKNKNKNKTLKQRGGFERALTISLKDIDNTKQDQLACILRDNPTLQNFAVDIFYDVLSKIKSCLSASDNPNTFNDLIKKNIIQTMDDKNVITNIGFTPGEADKILEAFSTGKKAFIDLDILKKKIHATTTSLTRLNNPTFQSLYIRNDPELFNEFLNKLRQIFNLPESFTKEDFLKIYNNDTTENPPKKAAFDMLIVKILHTSNNVLGAIQLNYGREIFTRVDRPRDFTKTSEQVGLCFNDIIDDTTDKIYGVANFLDTNNTFVQSIFDFYGRRLIGGLSGSAYYLFFLITKILKYPYDKKSILSKILCLAVMDYVPLWHSLEEILITYSVEFKKYGFPEYTMNEDPVEYFKLVVSRASLEDLRGREVTSFA